MLRYCPSGGGGVRCRNCGTGEQYQRSGGKRQQRENRGGGNLATATGLHDLHHAAKREVGTVWSTCLVCSSVEILKFRTCLSVRT